MDKHNAFGLHWHPQMEGGRIIHPQHPYEWYSDDVITPNGDSLELMFRNNPRDIFYDGVMYHPTIERAMFRTEEAFDYGTFSADIKLPKGKNITCALWMSGEGNWPPEIDICEAWNKRNTYLRLFSWSTTTNFHYRDAMLNKTHIGSKNISWSKMGDPSKNFHNYKVRWEYDRITFFVDGKAVRDIQGDLCEAMVNNLTTPRKGHKMNIILNCGVDKDPLLATTRIDTPMIVKNLKYSEL